jgi:hypothetical protein
MAAWIKGGEVMKTNPDADRISVSEAAKISGMHPSTIMQALRNGTFPVGCAIQIRTRGKKRYVYHIPRTGFMNYMAGIPQKDMDPATVSA